MSNIQTEALVMSNWLQFMLTKEKEGCWKIIFGSIESAYYLIETKAIATRTKLMEDHLSSIQAAKAAIAQISYCTSLLTQPLN